MIGKKSSFRLEERIITTDESVCVCIIWVKKEDEIYSIKAEIVNDQSEKNLQRKKKSNQNFMQSNEFSVEAKTISHIGGDY